MIFSIFRFFCTLRFQIYKYCPIITNHTSMEIYLFSFQMLRFKMYPYDWFCGPGSRITHIIKNHLKWMKNEKHKRCTFEHQMVLHQRLGCLERLWVRSWGLKVCCVLIQHYIPLVSLRLAPIIWNSFATLVSMFLQITGRPAARGFEALLSLCLRAMHSGN